MPLKPNVLERLAFHTLNLAPGPGLDLWSGPAFWSVHAALKLNLFETLGNDAMTLESLAEKLSVDGAGLKILLGVLGRLGYVQGRDTAYRNSPMTKKWFVDSGEVNFAPFYLYWGALMKDFMPNLEESIRSGSPPVNLYEWIEDQPEVSGYFQEGMIRIARYTTPDILKALEIPTDAKRVLDVGGGHGEYSIALCRKYQALSAVIFDGAQALVTGKRAVGEAGLDERISIQEGNFITDDLPGNFDLALVFNIVHGLSPEANVELFRKIGGALNPGGRIVVLEQVHGIAPLPMIDTVSHILSMAYHHLIGGQVYSYEDIHSWLKEAGFSGVRRKKILKASSILVTAER